MSTQTYYTLLTAVGAAALTNAIAAGTTVALTHLALGDGAGDPVTPTEAATALVHEVHRVPITSVTADPENPSWLVIEAVVPSTVGGWTVRELGLIAAAGTLIAIGNFPPTYKPVLAEGAGRDLLIRMIVETTNAAQVTLTLDPSVVVATNQAIVNAVAGYVKRAGDTMTGALTLSGSPTAALHAAPKSYVDALAAQRARRFFHAGF